MQAALTSATLATAMSAAPTVTWSDVTVTEDKDKWLSLVGEVATADFTGFTPGTIVIHQYYGLGALFTDGDDVIEIEDPGNYPNDGWGCKSYDTPFVLEFAGPQSWLAIEFSGFVRFRLFNAGEQVFLSSALGAGGDGNFAGLLAAEAFDEAHIEDAYGDLVVVDDIHFGPRMPGDATGDGLVDTEDIVAVIVNWGPCPPAGPCPADMTTDGQVDTSDLLEVILGWYDGGPDVDLGGGTPHPGIGPYADAGAQVAKLLASDPAPSDHFGDSVAISGAIAIVAAPDHDAAGDGAGAAYTFDATTGQQIAKLLAEDGAADDEFGCSVGISGTTAIVGARLDDDQGPQSGAAYLFDAISGQQLAKLLPDDGAEDDRFGKVVAISGDIAIIGASDDDNGPQSGAAYLFDVQSGEQTAKLLPDDGEAYDAFGIAVAISDGIAIIGAYGDDDRASTAGAAYLFDATSGQQLAKLLADDGSTADELGRSVGISGGVAIVGAYKTDDHGQTSGAAYLFDVQTGQQIAKLFSDDIEEGDEFGQSVGICGPFAVIGGRSNSDYGFKSGSAYLFDVSTGQQIAKLLPHDPSFGDHFGDAVAITGDMAIIGAHFSDDDGSSSGSAYLFATRVSRLRDISLRPGVSP